MKRHLLYTLLFLFAFSLFWFALMFKQSINHAFDAENRGHMYRNFFIVLEMHVEQTGQFPTSLDDMKTVQIELGYEGIRWPQNAQLYANLIQPNFDIAPNPNNLDSFAPDYKLNAAWADVHCESHWSQIIEHLSADQ